MQLLELTCACGTALKAYAPDEGEYINGEGYSVGVPTLREFTPWWEGEEEGENEGWVAAQWEEFIEDGYYAASLEDALRKDPIHDVYATGAVLMRTGTHTPVAA